MNLQWAWSRLLVPPAVVSDTGAACESAESSILLTMWEDANTLVHVNSTTAHDEPKLDLP